VKVRPDGTVKVLDFGLAKALEPTGALSSSQSMSPTITTPAMTQAGMILGTAAYMSPEQARGRATDRRSDVWAFGAVLYEMLTGRRAFPGEDVTDTIAAVVRSEPDWAALGAEVPARVQRVLRLCLQKSPQQRVGDIAAIRLALDGAFETAAPQASPTREAERPAARRMLMPVAAGVAATILLAGLAAWTPWPAPEPRRVSRFEITTPPEAPPRMALGYSDLAISPDGSRIAYASGAGQGNARAWLREIDQLDATELRGSDRAADLFFSPDSERVGFQTLGDGTWKQVSARGGPVSTIVVRNANFAGGASWGADGTAR
jgi:eukaryotic-like serine/threonine-protein kinase